MRAPKSTLMVAAVLGLLVGTAVAVTAQGEETAPQPPVEVTGVWCIGPAVAPAAWRNAVSMSDPRLQGQAYQTYQSDTYSELGIEVTSSTLSIVNEEGAWVSRRYRSTGTPADAVDTGDVFMREPTKDSSHSCRRTGRRLPRDSAEYPEDCTELRVSSSTAPEPTPE